MRLLSWIVLVGSLAAACAPPAVATPTAIPPTAVMPPTAVPPTERPALAPAVLAGPQAGSSMLWLDGAMLVFVPGGEFTMGSGVGDAPEKSIFLDAYWIYATAVTNKMYAQCVATGNCAPPAQEVGSPVYTNTQYGDFPVVGVTWDMASNYCGWAEARLPTEAQWEKAARGSDGSVFPWGISQPECSLANFKGCLGHTSSVADFPEGRSPYGAYDMAGNVFQWVNDFYDEGAYNVMEARNPTGPATGTSRVLRGSSYETEPGLLPLAIRHFGAPAYHSSELGFRCAVPEPKPLAPYCQQSAYVPTGAGPSASACELPELGVQRNYCEGRVGFATITIPDGASYRITTPGYRCSDAVVNGERLVTCSGPDLSSGKLSVCNDSCSSAPSETGAPVECDPGYGLDSSGGVCTYDPVALDPTTSGCPTGYNLIQRGDRKICAPGLNQNGQCGPGTYFDGQYGACVSPTAGAEAPYGIDDPAAASQFFQGCAAGYAFDPTSQCCQAITGGAYPGCPMGFAFDPDQNACVPHRISVSSPGCVTVTMNIARCQPVPEDICGAINDEATCKRTTTCDWNDQVGICRPK